jgi:hypothetical protein
VPVATDGAGGSVEPIPDRQAATSAGRVLLGGFLDGYLNPRRRKG